jgi:hypothetical protein
LTLKNAGDKGQIAMGLLIIVMSGYSDKQKGKMGQIRDVY